MQKATDVLMSEHRGIERLLRVLEVAAVGIEAGERVPPDTLRKAVDFFRGFADGCHHAKEERTLFPLLEQRGIPRQGPIGVMLDEHERGRQYVREIGGAVDGYEQGDAASGRAIVENARGYVGLLRQHIMKEDNVLFRTADQLLTADDQADLVEQFEEIERIEMGERTHERYHGMMKELEHRLGLTT